MKTNSIEYLIKTTAEYPDKVAIRDRNGEIVFSTLLSNACDLAEEIMKKQFSNKPIAVFLPKSREMISCFAGINLSGNFYVPLDCKQPKDRIEKILNTLGSDLILTDDEHSVLLPDGHDAAVLKVEEVFQNKNDYDRAAEILNNCRSIDTDPIYSIFTSGSTGDPKGVVVNHRGVIDYIDWAVDTFGIAQTSVIGNQAPFYFDNSTLDIYLMYATGATLDIIPEENFAFPARLIDYLNDNKITFVFWVPFVLINIANFRILDKKKPEYLKDVFFAGEVMPNRQLNYWRARMPECRYVNLYGPTEITVDCTFYIVNREFSDDEPLPIGIPCKNTDILILKDRKEKCGVGETGEICVRGSSLAHGYYNNSEKTRDAFIDNPLQKAYRETIYCTGDLGYWNEYGEVMFVGRADTQIKHKGYRIELGEIENAIGAVGLVEECCVVYNHAKQRITLIYSSSEDIDLTELKKEISSKLPAYMLPTAFVRETEMRRNQNGKIDRAYYNKSINNSRFTSSGNL